MNKPDEDDFKFELNLKSRPKETVTLQIPQDTLEILRKVAISRDMAVEALIRFYVGQGLRQDTAKLFADHVLETTANVLARHLQSEEEISSIIREIRTEAVGAK